MLFNKNKLLSLLVSLSVVTCGKNSRSKYLIGEPLVQTINEGVAISEDERTAVFFDDRVGYFHLIDLGSMTLKNSIEAEPQNKKSTVYVNHDGKYFVAFASKSLAIYDVNGLKTLNPLNFQGTPISVALSQSQDFLVVYDDLGSVGILNLSESGEVTGSFLGGPVVTGNQQILAGDIDSKNTLILALSEGSFSFIDLGRTIEQQQYVLETRELGYEEVSWIAPLKDSDLMMMTSKNEIILYDMAANTEIEKMSFSDVGNSLFLSKSPTPHVLVRSSSTQISVIFPDSSQHLSSANIAHATQEYQIIGSRLDSTQNNISLVLNGFLENVRHVKLRLSDNLVVSSRDMVGDIRVRQADDFIFVKYPSPLGYLEKLSLSSENNMTLKKFNLPYLD